MSFEDSLILNLTVLEVKLSSKLDGVSLECIRICAATGCSTSVGIVNKFPK